VGIEGRDALGVVRHGAHLGRLADSVRR